MRRIVIILATATGCALTGVVPAAAAPDPAPHPAPQAGISITPVEGLPFSAPVATITCPNHQTPWQAIADIEWERGSASVASTYVRGRQLFIAGTHAFSEEGPGTGLAFGSYFCGNVQSKFDVLFQENVADAPLTVTGVPVSSTPGTPTIETVATFTDADPAASASDYSVTIDWGNGQSTGGNIFRQANGSFYVMSEFTYSTAGVYRPSITISDSGGAMATAATTASIATTPATAHFVAPAGVKRAGAVLKFDAQGSHGTGSLVTGYTWSLRGPGVLGGHYSATCPGYTSGMESGFHAAGPVAVTLTVTYASGLISSTAQNVGIATGRIDPLNHRAIGKESQWVLCTRTASDPIVKATANGGPPAGCQDVYYVGNVQAIGCITALNAYTDIPKPEYKMLCPFFTHPCGAVVRAPPGLGLRASQSARRAGSGRIPARICGPACERAFGAPLVAPVMSTSTIRMNGIDLTPLPGAAIVLSANDGVIGSSNAEVGLLKGKLSLRSSGPFLAASFNVNGDVPVLKTDLTTLLAHSSALRKLLDLAGFHVTGTATVTLAFRKSLISADLELPSSFTDSNGGTLSNQISMTADNASGLKLDDLLIQVPAADFGGGLQLDSLKFCYQSHASENFCQRRTGADFGSADSTASSTWNATGNVNIAGTDISAVPSSDNPQQGIGFVDGNFDFGGATVSFNPSIPIGSTGVDLSSISASLGLNPTEFDGQLGLTAEDLVTINGALFLVFASSGQPYAFTGHELGGVSNMPTPTVTSFAVAVGGSVGLTLPVVGDVSLASGYLMYAYPGYVALGGNVSASLLGGDLGISGGINGQMNFGTGQYNIEGNVDLHALWIDLSADGVISSSGIAGCGRIGTLLGHIEAGGGYHWGGGVDVWFGGCDLGSYRVTVPATAQVRSSGVLAPATVYRTRLPAGLPSEMIKVTGTGGAPDITITGPGGVHASTNGQTDAAAKPFLLHRLAAKNVTYIAILKPAAGVYTITANAGSAPITRVTHADVITPSIRATLARQGRTMVLTYSDRHYQGQRITFAERTGIGIKVIGATTASRGTFRFTPAPGPGGPRQIVAEITENGAPVMLRPNAKPGTGTELVVATYRAPGPPRLGRVAHLSVRHNGAQLLVSFSPVRGARLYELLLTLPGRQHELFLTKRDKETIRGVFGDISGTLSVQAVGNAATSTTGPALSVRFGVARGD